MLVAGREGLCRPIRVRMAEEQLSLGKIRKCERGIQMTSFIATVLAIACGLFLGQIAIDYMKK